MEGGGQENVRGEGGRGGGERQIREGDEGGLGFRFRGY